MLLLLHVQCQERILFSVLTAGNTCLANENANIEGLLFSRLLPPPPTRTSRLCCIVDIDSDSDDGEPSHGADKHEVINVPVDGIIDERTESEDIMMQNMDGDAGGVAGDNADADEDSISRAALCRRWGTVASSWHQNGSESDSDTESEPPYPRLEDSDDETDNGFVDWKAIEEGNGLSAWDQLGESYEAEAAEIGVFSATETNNVIRFSYFCLQLIGSVNMTVLFAMHSHTKS